MNNIYTPDLLRWFDSLKEDYPFAFAGDGTIVVKESA